MHVCCLHGWISISYKSIDSLSVHRVNNITSWSMAYLELIGHPEIKEAAKHGNMMYPWGLSPILFVPNKQNDCRSNINEYCNNQKTRFINDVYCSTRIRTGVARFKVWSANHYTIPQSAEPLKIQIMEVWPIRLYI